jgi:hypothetical protein
MDAASFLEPALLYVVLPLWLLSGLADALCHRALRIESTSGWRESALHWLMLAELAFGLGAVLLLELNAFVIALFLAACLLHEVTMAADLAYAGSRRTVPPVEQWVHGVQHALPWIVLVMIAAIEPALTLAILRGEATSAAVWQPRFAPRAPGYLVPFAAAAALLVILPFASEAWRTITRSRRPT